MSDTSVTLPQSAIPLVGFLPAGICYLWVSRFGPVWTREGLPGRDSDAQVSNNSQKVKSRNKRVDETIPLELPNGRTIKLGTGLQPEQHKILTHTLISNTDLFVWSAVDLPDIDLQVASHKLSIYKDARYVSQKKRKLCDARRLAAKTEADKLINAGFIEEAHYTTWLSNVVLVKKANGKWRMCVDYTDLNTVCPRDAYW